MSGDDVCIVLNVGGVSSSIRRTTLPQRVNGREVDYFADPIAHEAVVTDDGDPDALVARTACAVRELLIPTFGDDAITPIGGPIPTCPLLPDSEAPSLYSSRRGPAS